MRKPARCACGVALDPGARAGVVDGKLRCLRCLADLRAGRELPRRRAASRPAKSRKPRRWTALIVTFVVLAAVGTLYVRSQGLLGPRSGLSLPSKTHGVPESWPPVPPDARANPLGAPPAKASSSTEFSFIHTVDSADGTRPVAWDPCRPIHLVVNDAEAPADSDKLLHEATAQITAATGLQFVFDGPTSEAPSEHRAPEDRARYGDKWSPVLVAWTDPATVPQLKGSVAGLAGPDGAPYFDTDQEHWVSGSVNLDGPQLSDALRGPAGWQVARAIVMHEFGHLVGLQHVQDPKQLMYADTTGRTTFGAGDREGLRQLGLGPCFSD